MFIRCKVVVVATTLWDQHVVCYGKAIVWKIIWNDTPMSIVGNRRNGTKRTEVTSLSLTHCFIVTLQSLVGTDFRMLV